MSKRVVISGREVIDSDDVGAQVTIPFGGAETTVVSFTLKHGNKVYISALANAVASGGESVVTFRFKRNGSDVYPYSRSTVQWSDPADPKELVRVIPCQGGDLIEVTAANSDGAVNYAATARVQTQYEAF